jgi:hypothetical protein
VARAAVEVATLWPYISWRSGHGQSEDEVRKARFERNPNLTEEDEQAWSDVVRWALYAAGLLSRHRTEKFFDTLRLVAWEVTDETLMTFVRTSLARRVRRLGTLDQPKSLARLRSNTA